MTISQAFDAALQHQQAGRLVDAEALYRQILAAEPNHADALHLLGVIAHQRGRHDAAVEWIRKAIAFNPAGFRYYLNLGNALLALGRGEDAIASYERALELKPDYPEAHHNLASALGERGRLDEAIAGYRRAIEAKPDYPEAHNHLANALRERGEIDESIEACRRAIQLKPNYPEAHNNLGAALAERGQFGEAIAAYRRALELKPDYPVALNNLGNALRERGEFDEAVSAFRRALELKPSYPEAHGNLGNAFRDCGQLEQAVAAYRQAIKLKPDLAGAHYNLGIALGNLGRIDEAIAAYRRALEFNPAYPEAYNNLGNALKDQGELDEALAAYRHALRIKPDDPGAHSNLFYALHFHPDCNDTTIAGEGRRWNRQFSDPLKQFLHPHANDPSPERRLRIGYVSPDFGEHVVGRNLLPLFRRHDRRNLEIFCYAGVARPDKLTEEFRQRSDQWRSTVGMGDEALAEMIRRDGVDILVDLTQHLSGNRLPAFARKPAPVQVSFAGYPESTGLEAIENRISDRYLHLSSTKEKNEGTEHVCLIDSFWCYDPCGMEVEVNALPVSENGTVTFGCLNNFCKVNEPVLKLWAAVLGRVKDSRLVLASRPGSHRQRTQEALGGQGVEARRVVFVEYRPRREYLELYHRLDIALDTFPYNGHTTSLDALWMGVPVVSLAGNSAVSRAGLSQLSNLGLCELVARSEADYVRIAAELAEDLPRLRELRSTLRARMTNSILMDAPRFTRQVEHAYREMWRAWCSGQRKVEE